MNYWQHYAHDATVARMTKTAKSEDSKSLNMTTRKWKGLVLFGARRMNKLTNIVAAAAALVLFFTACEILRLTALGVEIPAYDLWVPTAALPLGLVFCFFARRDRQAGRRLNLRTLIAYDRQLRAYVMSSIVVFVSLLGYRFGVPLDRIAGGVIAAFTGYAAWNLLSNNLHALLRNSGAHGTLARSPMLLEEEPAVGVVECVIGLKSGRFIFVETTVDMRLPGIVGAHSIPQRIENNRKRSN